MTPRWQPVIAAATPREFRGELILVDQAIESVDYDRISSRDIVGISTHSLNAARTYALIRRIKETSGATVVVGGVHATTCHEEVLSHGADSVVVGDGELAWNKLISDRMSGRKITPSYSGGRLPSTNFDLIPRWDLMRHDRYLIATVQTTRGCPESCTFCSVWMTDGKVVRYRSTESTIEEILLLYKLGFRYIVLADDNFYAVGDPKAESSKKTLENRYQLMEAIAERVPVDMRFGTQTTIRTADDPDFLSAMRRARIQLALIGIESVKKASLASINKRFNKSGDDIVDAIRRMQISGIFVIGSHIVGLPLDSVDDYEEMLRVALTSRMAFAQFVLFTYFPGTVDYELLRKGKHALTIKSGEGRYWEWSHADSIQIIHPHLTESEMIRARRELWRAFYSIPAIIRRAISFRLSHPGRFASYVLFSTLFYRLYLKNGVSADSVRTRPASMLTRTLGFALFHLMKESSESVLERDFIAASRISPSDCARAGSPKGGRNASESIPLRVLDTGGGDGAGCAHRSLDDAIRGAASGQAT